MTILRLTLALLLACYAAHATGQPNIVLIVADDLGYGDLGVYGSKQNRTPNIDRLAAEGLRFTDFHSNGPMCTPTRAALMTGRYQNRLGRRFEGPLSGLDDYDHGLPLEAVTIAEVLKKAGYATAAYGKWHLGYHPPYLPCSQGFDEFRGLGSGDGDHHSHIDRTGRPDWWHNNRIEMESGYTAELLTRHGVNFIERNKDRPFFLYIPHLAIHFPWQGPDDEGYRVEGGNYHNLTKLGKLTSKDIAPKVKEMVEAVDESTGKIIAALEKHGLTNNTLVIVTSDNGGYLTYQGGHHNISSNGPLRGQKGEIFEGGHRVPAIARWPGRIKPGVTDKMVMTFDLFPTLAKLAGASIAALNLDGTDINGLLFDQEAPAARTLFWRRSENKAVRQGDWKLLVMGDKKPELYNLKNDIGETKDLSAAQPELIARLLKKLAQWESDIAGDLQQ